MTSSCIKPKDLPGVLAMPADDDRRRHVETCLHCRAMVHAYEEFMDPDIGRAGFDVEAAETERAGRLAGVLAVPRVTRRRGSTRRLARYPETDDARRSERPWL